MNDVVDRALPCPFCGEKPNIDKTYMPIKVEISCSNPNCPARPSVSESVRCLVQEEGGFTTLVPQFEKHWQNILDKWNTRKNL